ncbi:MAG: ABC transporter ATP-binding protein [Acidimicrobiales bacterium]|jgi:oligopeptide/dipeptide ABC transporter ATP-binding protein
MNLLELRRVSHWYRPGEASRPALRDVSLLIAPNEVVAVVGESGCGKTTLGKLVAGLYSPSAGEILFEDQPLRSLQGRNKKHYRRSVQLVHQDPYASLNPAVTIGDTIAPALVHHGLARRHNAGVAAARALGAVGLDATPEFLDRYPHQLSGGQRQRVAIARAVSLEPSLVVADEATSMLDVSVRVAVLDLLLSLKQHRELAYLFISHDFGVVRYFARAGRIIVMLYGVVVEEGPTEQLIANPLHPYTVLLLQSVPVPDPARNEQRRRDQLPLVLGGAPPERGCVFSNRCPFATEVCRTTTPPRVEAGLGHKVRCWSPRAALDAGRSTQLSHST